MAANDTQQVGFPEGQAYDTYVRRRQRSGVMWALIFLFATFIGIIALVTLLATILNDSFGYVAIQNKIDPEVLVVNYWKDQVLAAPRQLNSEDDAMLAENIAARPTAIGYFGYAFYNAYQDDLRLQPIDGVAPNAASVESGEYKLSRPLFIYTTERIMEEKPQVGAFVNYYLDRVNEEIDDVGYFPITQESLQESLDLWARATGLTDSTVPAADTLSGAIATAGSSTVAPLTQRIADRYAEEGFSGNVAVDIIGTDAGFDRFCAEGASDIANASRPMIRIDTALCEKNGRRPLEFRVGGDGVAVVVSQENDFLNGVTTEQLQQIFTTAERWSDVDPGWPERPILRYAPSADSGTLDFFVAQVFGTDLEQQPQQALLGILTGNISAGRARALEAEQPLAERTNEELIVLIMSEVVKPQDVETWSVLESMLNRSEIEAAVAEMQNAELDFRSWINWDFITSPLSSDPTHAGIRTAILGSLWVTLIAFLVAVPIGTAAAIYLEEYSKGSRFDAIIETNINNLAGVPSIIYGMLGLAVFVRFLEPLTSGAIVGYGDSTTANGRTVMAAGLTLGLLILPLVVINAREAIRAVPGSLREASYGLGATKWQTVWNHVLPNAISGILTGVILAVSRAFGETAPLIVVGVSHFIIFDPNSPFAKYTTLTATIYQWTSRPQKEFQHLAAAAIAVLLVLLLALNATAIYLRNRYAQQRI